MSLPKTEKQISEHPGKNAVTAPANAELERQDVEKKMKLYQVIEAFRSGSYPSNKQCDEALEYALNNSPINTSQLSRDGQVLVRDVQDIIQTLREYVRVKNADELVQNWLWATRHVDTDAHIKSLKGVSAPADKEDAQRDGETAVEHLRTLGKLIFTNSEARKLLSDIGILGRDVVADAAANVADKTRPSEEQLRQADQPGKDAAWIAPDGSTRGPNDSAPDTGLQEKKENLQAKAQEAKVTVQQDAREATNRVDNATSDAANRGEPTEADKEAAKREGKQTLKEKTIGRIPDKHIDNAKEQVGKGKDYLREKFPQERRDRFIYRLKKVIVECQQHQDYVAAIDFFLDTAETYHGHAKDVANQGANKAGNIRDDQAYRAAEIQLRALAERTANNHSLQPLFDAINVIYTDCDNDPQLKEWFKALDSYIRTALLEPGYILEEESDREARRLQDTGKVFWDERYRAHRENLFNEIESFFRAYNEDPLNKKLGIQVKKLTQDLLLDSDGNFKYRPNLLRDIRHVIIPQLSQKAGYIPIPRAEYVDASVELVVENLSLQMQNMLPNLFEIEARNHFKLSPYDKLGDQSTHDIMITFSQVQADCRDVAFYFRKKTGFPKLKESGLADVVIAGEGLSGHVHLQSTRNVKHNKSVFTVKNVKVNIDSLKFKVRDAKRSGLINLIRPLATGIIKKAVAKAMEKAIRDGLVAVDQQLADIREKIEDQRDNEDSTAFSTVKDHVTEKKDQAQAKAEEIDAKTGKFQLTMKRDSMLVDYTSPVSIVGKQGEKQDLVQAGQTNTWKNNAFSIVDNPVTHSHHNAPGTTTAPTTGARAY